MVLKKSFGLCVMLSTTFQIIRLCYDKRKRKSAVLSPMSKKQQEIQRKKEYKKIKCVRWKYAIIIFTVWKYVIGISLTGGCHHSN
jgi:hypothetical protein